MMSAKRYSDAYVDHLSRGPFPGRVDPWAEAGRYFHQIHAGLIGELLERLRQPLLTMGYVAGRETSLQIAEQRQPDVAVWRNRTAPEVIKQWDYATAATELLVEPGVPIDGQIPELDALYIKRFESGDLVTVVEVISPRNKTEQQLIRDYTERRERLVWGKQVNLVEIDLTRSVKRVLEDVIVATYAYHIAVYLPQELPRALGIDFGEPLKSFALPLYHEAIVVETQAVYDHAYRQASAAPQLHNDGRYIEDELPFPSLLTNRQRQEALAAVAAWKEKLAQLKTE